MPGSVDGVFAEFERAVIRERVMAGLERAKASGIALGNAYRPGRLSPILAMGLALVG
jgi:DNA invertase Pin-like site-specific DNA recombinase